MSDPCKHWFEGMVARSETKCPFCEIEELRAALKDAESGPLSDEAFDIVTSENSVLKAKLAALESQPAAAEVLLVDGEKVIDASMAFFDSVELGTKLYLAAGAAPVQQEPFAHLCVILTDAGLTKFFTAPSDPRGFPVYLAAGAAPVPEGWRSAVAMAYGHLWHVNNEPMAPIPLRSEESASYAARKLLRDLMTTKERGEAINAVQKLLAPARQEPMLSKELELAIIEYNRTSKLWTSSLLRESEGTEQIDFDTAAANLKSLVLAYRASMLAAGAAPAAKEQA